MRFKKEIKKVYNTAKIMKFTGWAYLIVKKDQ